LPPLLKVAVSAEPYRAIVAIVAIDAAGNRTSMTLRRRR
jgi:hypothetical protein